MDKLQWFKFTPSDWMMGKIQRCCEVTQARFIRLSCLYWNKECLLTYEDAEIEIDKEHLDILLSKKIIKIDDDFIKIEFLDEQMEGITETSIKRRDAVLKRWNKVKQSDTSVLQSNTSVLQSDTDKSRVDKSRVEKEKKRIYDFRKSLIDLGVIENVVDDYLVVRKNKRLSNTETAFNKLKDEIEKSNVKANDVINICVEKSWGGFNHKWLDNINVEVKKDVPPFEFDFKKYGGDVNLFNKLKAEHERKYS